jgi:hypothetical protein
MLRAVRAILHGPLPEKWAAVPDANWWRKVPFVLLLGGLLVFGCLPGLLTEKIKPVVGEILTPAAPAGVAQTPRSLERYDPPPGLGVRQPSGAFGSLGEIIGQRQGTGALPDAGAPKPAPRESGDNHRLPGGDAGAPGA